MPSWPPVSSNSSGEYIVEATSTLLKYFEAKLASLKAEKLPLMNSYGHSRIRGFKTVWLSPKMSYSIECGWVQLEPPIRVQGIYQEDDQGTRMYNFCFKGEMGWAF